MTNRIQLFFITILFIFINQKINAQSNTNFKYLSQVGVLDSLYSQTLKESRDIYIQLPESYHPENNQKYPVVYVLDGELFLPTVTYVQHYYSGGFTPEMVIVGISNNKNRTRDLTTSTIKTKYGMPFNEDNGEAANFMAFIEKELIPFIENKYPVTHYRTLIGHSYGGLFAIYSLMNYPQVFENFLAIDPSLDWDDQNHTERS